MDHSLPGLDVARIRQDFPILAQPVRGRPLVFLDSGASAQKPRQVMDAMRACMETAYANVHRGAYHLSELATERHEAARETVRRFLNARLAEEIVFTGSSTNAINLVAHSFGRGVLQPGQRVLVSEMEHHANLVPWHMLRDDTSKAGRCIGLGTIRVTDAGELDLDSLRAELAKGDVGLVAVTHMSNVLGTVTPAAAIARMAHEAGARVLFDGSQAAVHRRVDMQALDADFYVFTGHKLYGPTGIGVLYAKRELLDTMPPFLGGGDMINTVSMDGFTWAEPPARFEAGTPPIIEAQGLKAAVEYVQAIGMEAIEAHERSLVEHAMRVLPEVPGLRVLGAAQDRGGVFAFALDAAHPHDLSTFLDSRGVCIRAGRHCAEPLHVRLGQEGGSARASFGLYTTLGEVDALADALREARRFFA